MKDIINFIRKPKSTDHLEPINLKIFLKLYIKYLVIILLLAGPLIIIISTTSIEYMELDVGWKVIIYAILIAPFLEEIIFRLLLKPSLKSLLFFNIVSIPILIANLIYGDRNYFFILAPTIIIWNIICLCYYKHKFDFEKHLGTIYYCSALIFAIGHIGNYHGLTASLFVLIPILILPYIFMGLFLGYIRMRFGVLYSILFHMLINFPILLQIS